MADDDPAPPLARRVPGAARNGPGSTTVPVLPDALLQRMQAAVNAARAAQVDRVENVLPSETAGAGAGPAKSAAPVRPGQPKQLWPPPRLPATATPSVNVVPGMAAARPVAAAPPAAAFVPVAGQAPPRPPGRTTRSRGPRVAGVAALAVILIAAGVVAVALSARGSSAKSPASSQSPASSRSPATSQPSPQKSLSQATVTANLAATWVAHQVSHGAIVACDNAMCDALAAAGFPGRHLKHIKPGAPYPVHAQVVVVTPVVERQFGFERNAQMAPPVLARIGSGRAAVIIRVVAPDGTARYKAQLEANQRRQRTGGAGLLSSRHVTASSNAKQLLLSGRVDARLIVVLTAIASVHPIDVVSFNAAAAGVSPLVPFRTAKLALNDPAAGMSRSDYLRFLITALDAQPGVYHPLTAGIADGPAGQQIFRITFSAPSPLNLLGG